MSAPEAVKGGQAVAADADPVGIELPLDIIIILISILPIKNSVRLIISSIEFYTGDMWMFIKRLEYNTEGKDDVEELKATQNFIAAMSRYSIAGVLTGITHLQLALPVNKDDFNVPWAATSTNKLIQLVRHLGPQLEVFDINKMPADVKNIAVASIIGALNPEKLRVFRFSDTYGKTDTFFKKEWPVLEELRISTRKASTLGRRRFDRLRRLELITPWDDIFEPGVLKTLQNIVERSPNLKSLSVFGSCDDHIDLDKRATFGEIFTSSADIGFIRGQWDRNETECREIFNKLAPVLRWHNRPVWLFSYHLMYDCQHYTDYYAKAPEFELFDLFMACVFLLEIYDNGHCATTEQLEWLDRKMRRVFDEQKGTCPPDMVTHGLVALCSALFDGGYNGNGDAAGVGVSVGSEPYWRRQLERIISEDDQVPLFTTDVEDLYCGMEPIGQWLKMLLEADSSSGSPLTSGLFKTLLPGQLRGAAASKIIRVVMETQNAILDSEDAFLRGIVAILAMWDSEVDLLFAYLRHADLRGWCLSPESTIFDENPHLECGIWSELITHDTPAAIEASKLLFRTIGPIHTLLVPRLARECYRKWCNFTRFGDCVREYCERFGQRSPSAIEKIESAFADSIWEYIFNTAVFHPEVDLDALVEAAVIAVRPLRHIGSLLYIEGEELEEAFSHLWSRASSYQIETVQSIVLSALEADRQMREE